MIDPIKETKRLKAATGARGQAALDAMPKKSTPVDKLLALRDVEAAMKAEAKAKAVTTITKPTSATVTTVTPSKPAATAHQLTGRDRMAAAWNKTHGKH